mmetsp:Transcript_3678/g.4939  ORF Transcript_3678/g.4939 Transcript_3678/m.4939 type:complete len:264 (-) Transcript_3678:75-866(-)
MGRDLHPVGPRLEIRVVLQLRGAEVDVPGRGALSYAVKLTRPALRQAFFARLALHRGHVQHQVRRLHPGASRVGGALKIERVPLALVESVVTEVGVIMDCMSAVPGSRYICAVAIWVCQVAEAVQFQRAADRPLNADDVSHGIHGGGDQPVFHHGELRRAQVRNLRVHEDAQGRGVLLHRLPSMTVHRPVRFFRNVLVLCGQRLKQGKHMRFMRTFVPHAPQCRDQMLKKYPNKRDFAQISMVTHLAYQLYNYLLLARVNTTS